MNYHHLHLFYVVATEGSITKAKEKLFLAQPTISGQIKELEAQLGRKLFDRKKQRLHLTEEGRFVLDYAHRIFDLGRELQDSLRDRPAQGKLRVQIGLVTGTPDAVAQSLVDYLKEAAHLTVREDDLGDLEEELQAHRLDLILSDRPLEGEDVISRLAGRIPVVFAAAPRLARRLRSLHGAPMILPSQSAQIQELLGRWKVSPEIVADVQDIELAKRMALSGRAVVPMNRLTLKETKGLVPVKTKPTGVFEPVYLIARKRKWHNPLAERALELFRI